MAGGAVLAAVLPLENNFEKLAPRSSYNDYEFQPLRSEQRRHNTALSFIQDVRWNGVDIDIFVYDLTAAEASKKLGEVFKFLKARLIELFDDDIEICFIKV